MCVCVQRGSPPQMKGLQRTILCSGPLMSPLPTKLLLSTEDIRTDHPDECDAGSGNYSDFTWFLANHIIITVRVFVCVCVVFCVLWEDVIISNLS